MLSLTSPRHTSTLPTSAVGGERRCIGSVSRNAALRNADDHVAVAPARTAPMAQLVHDLRLKPVSLPDPTSAPAQSAFTSSNSTMLVWPVMGMMTPGDFTTSLLPSIRKKYTRSVSKIA